MVKGVSILLWIVCAALTPLSRGQSSSDPTRKVDTAQATLYADAHSYVDEPMSTIEKTVHELAGLQAASSQDQLSNLLAKAGERADELLRKVPNLISDETVNESQWEIPHGALAGCIGTTCEHFIEGRGKERSRDFSYMILTHSQQDNRLTLAEYRTRRNGKPAPQGMDAPHFQGFIGIWLVFSSANQVESRFRYLGQQKMDGHNTFVIGFAQIPGSVESPGRILSEKVSVQMLLQGVAWIDQSDFRMVRLRSDLLAPQPQVDVELQTSKILFGSVKIADWDLWLPRSANMEMQANGQYLKERHEYSNYRLYQTKSKILLTPDQ